MRKHIIVLAVVILLLSPSVSMAYMNNVEVSLMSGSGSIDGGGADADVSMGGWGLSYTRFFSSLETDDSPYGAREFLQHPSYFAVALMGQGAKVEDNASNYEFTEG